MSDPSPTSKKLRILVTGAGGFIGHHMVRYLKKKGYWVRGVDKKLPEYSSPEEADEFYQLDLKELHNCLISTQGIDMVYTFAADMGGMYYIKTHDAQIMRESAMININMAEACVVNKVKRIFYSSSACIYPEYKQMDTDVFPLRESDAYPAQPDTEYGWEKLFSEHLYKSYERDHGLEVRIARYHNIFGPEGTYHGGKQKAPADLCRQAALAKPGEKIHLIGDGEQTRSFCFIDDCVEGTYLLMNSEYSKPLNIGSDYLVSINQLADIAAKVSGKKLGKEYTPGPQGVRGRNADLYMCKKVLNWEPKVSLEEGMRKVYLWIESELKKQAGPEEITEKKENAIKSNGLLKAYA
jgi:GDP-D-mannose 3', 5'-epimerase